MFLAGAGQRPILATHDRRLRSEAQAMEIPLVDL
jgi:hypothetical protein